MTTNFIYRLSLIVPVGVVDEANRIASVMGLGDNCFIVPITEEDNVSHMGLCSLATQNFIDMLNNAGGGTAPEGVDSSDLAVVLPVLLSKIEAHTANPGQQFNSLLSENGLSRFQEPDEF